MLTHKAACELAVHFNKKHHHMSDFEFIVIEKIVNDTTDNLDQVLLTRGLLVLAVMHPPTLRLEQKIRI